MPSEAYLFYFLLITAVIPTPSRQTTAQYVTSKDEEIYDRIFIGYRSELRPVHLFEDSIALRVRISLDSILGLNSKAQSLEVLASLELFWRDIRLTWDPVSEGLPSYFVVPVDSVWTPDIVIRNSVSSSPIDIGAIARPYLVYHGMVCLTFFSRIETRCSVDVRKFPFDTQECQIDLSLPRSRYDNVTFGDVKVKNSDDINAGDWIIRNLSAAVIQKSSDDFSEEILAVKITLSRHSSTYLVNTLLPLLGLFFLNPFVFLTPTGHGERISFSTSLLLSYAVTISSLSEVLPGSTEHVCYLSVMASVCFFISGFIAALVILISQVDERPGTCRENWGLVILCIVSSKYTRNSKVDVINVNPTVSTVTSDPLLHNMNIKGDMTIDEKETNKMTNCFIPPESQGDSWHEVASCLNRLAFVFTMSLAMITVITFLTLICF